MTADETEELLKMFPTIVPRLAERMGTTERYEIRNDGGGNDHGIDVAWLKQDGNYIYTDFKNNKHPYSDRIIIETTSIYTGPANGKAGPYDNGKRKTIGWTLDPTKRTHHVVNTWPLKSPNIGIQFIVLPFRRLLKASTQHRKAWVERYGELNTNEKNDGYLTLFVHVPTVDVLNAMYPCELIGTVEPIDGRVSTQLQFAFYKMEADPFATR